MAVPVIAAPPAYPDIAGYNIWDARGYVVAEHSGVWFSSPWGLNCGIWDEGDFGCTGIIPGAPTNANQIGWFDGDSAVHYDTTQELRFYTGQPQRPLLARTVIEYRGTTCATTPDMSVYCFRGPFRFLVSPVGSRING